MEQEVGILGMNWPFDQPNSCYNIIQPNKRTIAIYHFAKVDLNWQKDCNEHSFLAKVDPD
jgi:hypothetical protein